MKATLQLSRSTALCLPMACLSVSLAFRGALRSLAHPPAAQPVRFVRACAASRDPHALLGVPADASEKDIKAAYRAKVKKLHPDVNPTPAAAKQFQAVQEAYEQLSSRGPKAALHSRMPQASTYNVADLNARAARFTRHRQGCELCLAT